MYYFLTDTFASQLSGIEHAQIKRLRLFQAHGIAAKIIVRRYNRFMARDLSANDLTTDEVINCFDILQQADQASSESVTIQAVIPDDDRLTIVEQDGAIIVMAGQRRLFVIHGFNQQIARTDLVDHVEYFDQVGSLVQADYYDPRGFKSMTDFYGQDGGVTKEVNYRVDGQPVVTSFYQRNPQTGNIGDTLWILSTDQGEHIYDNSDEVIAYVLDRLASQDQTLATFISDRAYAMDTPMRLMKQPAKHYVYWHNIYTPDYDHPATGQAYDTFAMEMKFADAFDGLIVPSQRERDDMAARIKEQGIDEADLPVWRIPAPTVSDEILQAPQQDFTQRRSYHVICVARIHEQKRLEDLISAFTITHQSIPEATLSIHGYVNDNELYQQLQQQVAAAGLTTAVKFVSYTNDIDNVYNEAQLLALSSRYEGLNMALVEAQAHGVPLVAYDCNYGSADVIVDGQNGYLVENSNVDQLAQRMRQLLENQAQLAEMSKHAYELADRFSESNIWQLWKDAGIVSEEEK
ncbi:glycosyltransferase [Furfurilactobacillus curtus]|uniref:Poly(Glycerol-phosphate) alpha-glucosyltransferase n=1 Tax=Furfurilactobacillus curtus TaxID=1746200 RepID=A0ABQ5JUU9_9LACO